jgi:translation initiation factor 1
VTTITGAPAAGAELLALAARLKKSCGTGGSVKDGVIELQGDHREAVEKSLAALGWRVKRAGG